MTVQYTDEGGVTGVRETPVPASGQTDGYGGSIPTRHMIQYLGRWRRVYVMTYGNGGSPFVRVKGEDVFLDAATADRLGS